MWNHESRNVVTQDSPSYRFSNTFEAWLMASQVFGDSGLRNFIEEWYMHRADFRLALGRFFKFHLVDRHIQSNDHVSNQ